MAVKVSPHIVCSVLAWARVPTERARPFLGEKTSAVVDSAELEPPAIRDPDISICHLFVIYQQAFANSKLHLKLQLKPLLQLV